MGGAQHHQAAFAVHRMFRRCRPCHKSRSGGTAALPPIALCFLGGLTQRPQEARLGSLISSFPSRCQDTAARCMARAYPTGLWARTHAFSGATCLSVCVRAHTAPGEEHARSHGPVRRGMRGVGPQPEMGQDVLNHVRLGNKGDDAYGAGTACTEQRIGLIEIRGTEDSQPSLCSRKACRSPAFPVWFSVKKRKFRKAGIELVGYGVEGSTVSLVPFRSIRSSGRRSSCQSSVVPLTPPISSPSCA